MRSAFEQERAGEEADSKCEECDDGAGEESAEKCQPRQDKTHNRRNGAAGDEAEDSRGDKGAEVEPTANEAAAPTGEGFPNDE